MAQSSEDDDSGVDSRQLLLVGVCLFGLVTAAFLAPVTNENEPIGIDGGAVPTELLGDLFEFLLGQGPDSPEAPDGGGDSGPVPDWLIDLLDNLPLLDFDDSDSSEPRERSEGDNDGGDGGDGGGGGIGDWLRDLADDLPGIDSDDGQGTTRPNPCQVYVGSNPKPGSETTVLVTVEQEPASGVRVWFNDKYVGQTGAQGTVTGEVPYVDELEVTVESPIDRPCAFSRQPGLASVQRSGADGQSGAVLGSAIGATVGGGATGVSPGETGVAVTTTGNLGQDPAGVPDPSYQQGTPGGANNSSRYKVAGDARIRLEGEPYPNRTVTLVATVQGVPMRNATVTVQGERVGETDRSGRYRLSLPDRDSITVSVSRGDITGQRQIDILEVNIGFASKLVVPGETTTLNVRRDGAPVANATVTLHGQRLGTTGPNGELELALPLRADGTLRAVTDNGDATIPLWRAYQLTGGLSLLLLVLSTSTTWLTARRRDRAAARRVGLWWVGVAALFVGFAVWELPGLAVVGVALLLVGVVRYRRAVAAGGATAAQQTAWALDWCRRLVLLVVSGILATVDWLRRRTRQLAAWLGSRQLSLSRLRSLPAAVLARLRGLSRRRVGAASLAVGVVLAATVALGARGFVLSVLGVLLAAAGWWLWTRQLAGDAADETTGAAGTESGGPAATAGEPPALRRLWRRLAEWVTPDDWQTRTPAEVARRATEKGLPQGPVEALTEAFRDVEYGGQPEDSRRDAARAAWDRLELDRERDEEATEK